MLFGALSYLMRLLSWPASPVWLGFVLGPLMEDHFRRTMLISRGDWAVFLERPISATVLAITLAILIWTIWTGGRAWHRGRKAEEA